MELTAISKWLNTAFAGFDYSILKFYHRLAESCGGVFTPIAEFFGLIGELGACGLIIGLILLLFKNTRRAGFSMMLAVGFGAIITNLSVKEIVARPRPFQSGVAEFYEWWQYVGAQSVSEYSFPSGHVTAAMASAVALCLNQKRWWVILASSSYVVLMMASRNYLMVHYPTDVIGGLFTGAFGGILAYLSVKLISKALEKHQDKKGCHFILNSDIRNIRDCVIKMQKS